MYIYSPYNAPKNLQNFIFLKISKKEFSLHAIFILHLLGVIYFANKNPPLFINFSFKHVYPNTVCVIFTSCCTNQRQTEHVHSILKRRNICVVVEIFNRCQVFVEHVCSRYFDTVIST